MIISKEIEKYLARDEIIEKEFHPRGRFSLNRDKVYATNKRLFIIQSNSIRDIDYNHISSLELKQAANLPSIVIGLMCLASSVILLSLGLTFWWAWALGACGIVLFILGLIRTQFISMVVLGLPRAYRLSGYRSGLDSLFRIIREK